MFAELFSKQRSSGKLRIFDRYVSNRQYAEIGSALSDLSANGHPDRVCGNSRDFKNLIFVRHSGYNADR